MLSVRGMTRRFGDQIAVDDVSFTVPAGSITGFLGANGAGKTTIMRLIMGLLAPHAGEVYWEGTLITPKVRRRIGYMPEERGLYPKQRIADQLSYFGQLRGLSAKDAQAQTRDLLERFALADRPRAKLETLSLGNQQRVQIIAALIGKPLMLVLDEPFSGLDPLAIDDMSDILSTLAAKGIPVLFSSHQLELIDRLCDRVVILSHGRLVAAGDKAELLEEDWPRYRLVSTSTVSWLRDTGGVDVLDLTDTIAEFRVRDDSVRRRVVERALHDGDIVELCRVTPTLAEVYRRVVA